MKKPYFSALKFRNDYMWAHTYRTFYRLHDLATDWIQARQMCEAEGTTLLIPDSLDEMENLKVLVSNMKAHYTAIFVGIHDQFSDGNYVTVRGIILLYILCLFIFTILNAFLR